MAGKGRRGVVLGASRRRGQATVELALTLPVVALFSLGVLQIGAIGKDLLVVQHAAREGARGAAVEPTVAAAREAVAAGSSLDPTRTTVSLRGGSERGDHLTVTVTHLAPTNVPLVGALLPDIELSASVSMRVE